MIPHRIGLGCAGLVVVWGLGGVVMVVLTIADCLRDLGQPCSDGEHFIPVLIVGLVVLALTAAILWWLNRPPRDDQA